MNDLTIQETDILTAVAKNSTYSQRELAAFTDYALGTVNRTVRSLKKKGYIKTLADGSTVVTRQAQELLHKNRPENAIILAAGFGMRMVPINLETPKALLTIHGERLIERMIKQLHSAGVKEIHIVVGFMKEKFEYLIDKYGVNLIVNPDYASRNNLSSLALASRYIHNTYIVPSDIWCRTNPFSSSELYSWYMVSDKKTNDSDIRVNRKQELVRDSKSDGNAMIGICYLTGKTAETVVSRIQVFNTDHRYDNSFWEETLYGDSARMSVMARVIPCKDVAEINTYEQLRELDSESSALQSDAIDTIAAVFKVEPSDITDIAVLKKGMTNRSFLFNVKDKGKYIMRVPGEGTDKLIDRAQEAEVYRAISGKGLCDDPVYINPNNGYKITKFLSGVRNCDPNRDDDLIRCMCKLRAFHQMKLKVSHTFDIFGQIRFYQSLWNGAASMYDDHAKTTKKVFELKTFIDAQPKDWCLTHIDAVPDNFLFYKEDEAKTESLQLTDWEYAGMQDPHVDIAMFCIYAMYDKDQTDHLIDLYFQNTCPENVRTKIYCYIAACGLLWSNWCEYKAHLGIEFGEYSLRQYRFAKDYYRYAKERM